MKKHVKILDYIIRNSDHPDWKIPPFSCTELSKVGILDQRSCEYHHKLFIWYVDLLNLHWKILISLENTLCNWTLMVFDLYPYGNCTLAYDRVLSHMPHVSIRARAVRRDSELSIATLYAVSCLIFSLCQLQLQSIPAVFYEVPLWTKVKNTS